MKKILLILFVLMYSLSAVVSAADTDEDTDTAAATFAIEEAQDYKSPVTSRTYYKSGNTVTYDDKSASAFSSKVLQHPSGVQWVTGASGEDGDYAPYIKLVESEGETKGSQNYICLFDKESLITAGGTINIEFDIKLDTNCDRVQFTDLALWHDYDGKSDATDRVIFDSDGTIRGTAYKYPVGEWIHLKMVYDIEGTKWNVWVTDGQGEQQIVTNTTAARNSNGAPNNSRMTFLFQQMSARGESDEKAGFTLDNFLAYAKGRDISKYMTAEVTDSEGNVSSSDSVPVTGSSINLNFSTLSDATLLDEENIKIVSESGRTVPAEVSAEGNIATLTPSESLVGNAKYTVKISDGIRTALESTRPPLGTFTITAENTNVCELKDGSVSIDGITTAESIHAGDTVKFNFTVESLKDSCANAYVMACVYGDNGRLVSISSKTSATDTTDNISVTVPSDSEDEGYTVALYVANSLNGLLLMDSFILE